MPAINRVRHPAFAANASLSNAFYIGAGVIVGFQIPSAWTAALLTLQVSLDNVTYQNAYDSSGVEIQFTVTASEYTPVDPSALTGIGPYLKLRSGTSGSPVTQVSAVTVQVFNRVLGYAG